MFVTRPTKEYGWLMLKKDLNSPVPFREGFLKMGEGEGCRVPDQLDILLIGR